MKRSLMLATIAVALILPFSSSDAQVTLGTADAFAVLGGSAVTNSGSSIVVGELGVSPQTSVTGFPPGLVVGGTIHQADAVAGQAQVDLGLAYGQAAGLPCGTNLTGLDLGAMTLTPGVYCFSTSAQLTGTLTLNFQGNPDAFFVFQIGTTLTTASASSVVPINTGGATCTPNIFWQVGSSATLGTTTSFEGNILAQASISLTAGANVDGRLLARDGAVTLITNLIRPCSLAAALPPGGTALGNQDSCDVSFGPAATLLLPYFEVNHNTADRTRALDTAFTITNVSNVPAIAHVTVWTDWSFPVLDFNIFLTGYDVQGVSLYDILRSGILPQTSLSSPRGSRSLLNTANPNFTTASSTCANPPGNIPVSLLNEVTSALTGGSYFDCDQVGGVHANAIGYVTIDVAATCSQSLPSDPTYFATEILFDNQLIGDYLRLAPDNATGNFAGGNPMVHIKAVPPGGPVGGIGFTTYLPWTFYDRYTPAGADTIDRRQPLPALFAARFIGAPFNTSFAIWREGTATQLETANCDVDENASVPFTEFVRFDERENPSTQAAGCTISPCPPGQGIPETSAPSIDNAVFPPRATGSTDVGGWVYMNLAIPLGVANGFSNPDRPSQNWVIIRMTAEGTYGVDFDAAYLANGCSGRVGITSTLPNGAPQIGPQDEPVVVLPPN